MVGVGWVSRRLIDGRAEASYKWLGMLGFGGSLWEPCGCVRWVVGVYSCVLCLDCVIVLMQGVNVY